MSRFSPCLAPATAMFLAFALVGCAGSGGFSSFRNSGNAPETVPVEPEATPEVPASVRPSQVIGSWGYASFRWPEHRARIEAAAKSQCAHPFVIGQGPTGGVMMYPPDRTQMQEFWIKGGEGGKNYIGPHGDAGGTEDREIVSLDGRVMVLRDVDEDVAARFGTGIYVRCAPRA
jgi:hypothetical protein